ncbi:MAG: putative membrane protein [Rhodothermales bacterium]|jgi:putative membrane protein
MIPFTKAELEAIRQAVKSAEGQTSGEIVPFVSVRSSDYTLALWRAAGIMSLLGLGAFLAAGQWSSAWGAAWLQAPWALALVVLLSGGVGWLAAYSIPAVKRLIIGQEGMAEAVHARAIKAFVQEEVFDTRDRTGILLFVSQFERRIEVMGDAGINAAVSSDDWVDVIKVVKQGITDGKLADALVAGIGRCGDLLERKGVEIKPDDTNELPDGLRFDSD